MTTLEVLRGRACALEDVARSDTEEAARLGEQLFVELQTSPPGPERDAVDSLIGSRIAHAMRLTGELRDAFDRGLRADAAAERSGDPDARALARLTLGHVFFQFGQFDEARRWLGKVAEVPEAKHEYVVRARLNQASALRAEGRLDEATAAFETVLAFRGTVPPDLWGLVLHNAASCWNQVGRTDDALEALEEARACLESLERPDLVAWNDAIAAWAYARRGDATEARLYALAVLRSAPSLDVRISAARALAMVACEHEPSLRPEALALLQPLVAEAEESQALQHARALHDTCAALCELSGDLVGVVDHLRTLRRLEGMQREVSAKLRLESDELRLEMVRLQVETASLKMHQEQLAAANQALAASDAARARLLRTLAHDLRNPLTSLFGALYQLDPDRPHTVRDRAEDIGKAATRLLELLNAAVEPSRSTPRTAVDAVGAVGRCLGAFRGLASRRGQRLVMDGPEDRLQIRAEPEAIARVLDNLVSNALKYSGEGAEIRVAVRATERRIDLTVQDDGPGFPGLDPQDGLLFGHQFTTRSSASEGSCGIGLHTVFQLVAEQGGMLALGNRPEGGAIVRVSLRRV